MKFTVVPQSELPPGELGDFFKASPGILPFSYCAPGETSRTVEAWWRQRSQASHVLGLRGDGRLRALAQWGLEAWDTEQFSIPMGRLEVWGDLEGQHLAGLVDLLDQVEASAGGLEYLFARVPVGAIGLQHAMEDRGYRSLGTLVTFARAPSQDTSTSGTRLARPSDVDTLRHIASSALHATSRFHSDPLLDRVRADQAWASSVESSLKGRADAVWVAEQDGTVTGVATVREQKDAATLWGTRVHAIDILAVADGFRRQGNGRSLTRACCATVAGRGGWIEVGTQVYNIPAVRLYEQEGFRLVRTSASYRKWLKR